MHLTFVKMHKLTYYATESNWANLVYYWLEKLLPLMRLHSRSGLLGSLKNIILG
jgi:hypothetical protein